MNTRSAFSLFELLVVITVIALLAGMLMASLGVVRSSARSAACQNNLRQIGLALVGYGGEQEGQLPPITLDNIGPSGNGDSGLWYTNLLSNAGMVDFPTWAYAGASKWGDIRTGIFHCPEWQKSRMINGGGYGFVWSSPIFHKFPSSAGIPGFPGVGLRLGTARPEQIIESDDVCGKTAPLGYAGKSDIGVACPLCSDWTTWASGAAPRHRLRSNVVCLDGHVESRMVDDLRTDATGWGHL